TLGQALLEFTRGHLLLAAGARRLLLRSGPHPQALSLALRARSGSRLPRPVPSRLTPLGIVCIDFPPSQRQVGRGPTARRLRGLGPLGIGCIDCPLSRRQSPPPTTYACASRLTPIALLASIVRLVLVNFDAARKIRVTCDGVKVRR